MAEGAHQRHQLQHVLRHALAAAHQRRVQYSAGQADLRLQPFRRTLIISFNYITPRIRADGDGDESAVVGGARLDRERSSALSERPADSDADSANNLLANLQRGPSNNPAVWGGGYTFMNRVPGQPLFLVNPNSKFDPTKQLVLNPAAWIEPAVRHVRGICGLLQRLPLAAAARREHGFRANLLD